MDTLTILFAGLIAHVMTDGGAQRAVLVNAPQHEARLIVAEVDVLENRGFVRDARGGYKLEGEHVTIDGIARGDAAFDASYLRSVPSLTRVSDGTTLLPEIETASPHAVVAAYLDLGRGTLSVAESWNTQVTFGKSKAMCIASTVAFRAPTSGDVTFRTASGKSLRVRGNATVRISNDPANGANGNHFHMYARLLFDATTLSEPEAVGSCGGRRRVATHGLSIGCSNSNYP